MKNAKLLLLTVVLLLTLTGCRTRTTVPVDPIPDENGETAEDQLGQTDRAEVSTFPEEFMSIGKELTMNDSTASNSVARSLDAMPAAAFEDESDEENTAA